MYRYMVRINGMCAIEVIPTVGNQTPDPKLDSQVGPASYQPLNS